MQQRNFGTLCDDATSNTTLMSAAPSSARAKPPRKRRRLAAKPDPSPSLHYDGERLLPMRVVTAVTSYSPSSINRLIDSGDFPVPLRLGPHKVAFRESEVRDWVSSRTRRAVVDRAPR